MDKAISKQKKGKKRIQVWRESTATLAAQKGLLWETAARARPFLGLDPSPEKDLQLSSSQNRAGAAALSPHKNLRRLF